MASRQTWDRRLLAGLLGVIDEKGLTLIDGLEIDDQGRPTEFFYDVLSEAEVERIEVCFDALRERLSTRLERLGGAKSEEVSEAEVVVSDAMDVDLLPHEGSLQDEMDRSQESVDPLGQWTQSGADEEDEDRD